MANRSFISDQAALLKRLRTLFACVRVAELGAVALQKFNYPSLGGGPNVYTYTAAGAGVQPSGWPNVYQQGADGVRSVTRTAAGLWTVQLQDNYVRMVGLSWFVRNVGAVITTAAIAENSSVSSMGADGGSIIGLGLNDFAGAAADPAAGDMVFLTFVLADGTEP